MAKAKYTKGSDGYFQTKVWDGNYINGQKHRISLRTRKSSRTLERMVNEHNWKMKEREYIRITDTKFLAYAREWKQVYKSNLSCNTKAMYENIIETHLCRVDCNIQEINRLHYHLLMQSIPGERTRQQASMTFKQIVKSAIKDKLLPYPTYNEIFDDAIKIKYKPQERRPLHPYENKAVFKADLLPSDRLFLYLLYGCGLRRGEALALQKSDIDLTSKSLSVNKSLAFDGNKPYEKEPKTENGFRHIPIPDLVLAPLESYLAELSAERLFSTKNQTLVTKSCYESMWKRIVGRLNLVSEEPIVGLTAHIFRHNFCTSLCYMIPRISIPQIARLLGDTDKMVIDVYNHVIEARENPQEIISNALSIS